MKARCLFCNTCRVTVWKETSGADCLCAPAAEDDIVMQTFKKQQHSYRELLKGMQVR